MYCGDHGGVNSPLGMRTCTKAFEELTLTLKTRSNCHRLVQQFGIVSYDTPTNLRCVVFNSFPSYTPPWDIVDSVRTNVACISMRRAEYHRPGGILEVVCLRYLHTSGVAAYEDSAAAGRDRLQSTTCATRIIHCSVF